MALNGAIWGLYVHWPADDGAVARIIVLEMVVRPIIPDRDVGWRDDDIGRLLRHVWAGPSAHVLLIMPLQAHAARVLLKQRALEAAKHALERARKLCTRRPGKRVAREQLEVWRGQLRDLDRGAVCGRGEDVGDALVGQQSGD